jgi:hypothetical protein
MSPKIVDGSFAALFDNNEVHLCSTIEGKIELKLNGKVVFGFWTRRFFCQKGNGSLAEGRKEIAYPSGYSDYYVF